MRAAANSAKRVLAQSRGIVKKAVGYSIEVVKALIRAEILPHWQNPERIDAFAFRSIVRAVVIYHTLCRFDDFARLRDMDFEDKGTYINVIFERSKNNQWGDNSVTPIAARPGVPECPVQLIRLYFRRFGL